MGFMDFLKGGKKRGPEDLGLGDLEKDLGADLGLPELGETPPAPVAPPEMPVETPAGAPQAFQSEEPSLTPSPLDRQVRELPTPGQGEQVESNSMYSLRKEMEVLSSKMDAIRSSLESMNQRLINIERMAMHEQEKTRKAW